jgi:hypothetical protein
VDGQTVETKDRPFDSSRVPRTEEAAELVRLVAAKLSAFEQRKRRRRADDQRRYEAAVTALVCDLAHRHLGAAGGWVAVPLGKRKLTKAKRKAEFMTESFADVVKSLVEPTLGIAEFRRGYRTDFGGVESTLRAAEWLQDAIFRLGLTQAHFRATAKNGGDPIVLRSSKYKGAAKNLIVPDTEEVRRLRAEVIAINEWLEAADLDYRGSHMVDVYGRRLRRIFNNANFQHGGRLVGGFWQNMSSGERLTKLRIADEKVASVDFAQLGVTVAYGEAAAEMPKGDLYKVPLLPRNGVKRVLNALLAMQGQLTRFPSGTRALFGKGWRYSEVEERIRAYHHPIAHLFGTGLAPRIQHIESTVLVRVLLQLRELGVVGLPIHDCVIVRREDASGTKDIMEATFFEVAGVRAEAVVEVEEDNNYAVDNHSVHLDTPSTKRGP